MPVAQECNQNASVLIYVPPMYFSHALIGLAAALFFAKETAVTAAVLLPIATALIRFKSQRLSSIFLFSLLFPLGAIIAWILIKMQLPMSTYLTSGARYSPKLNPITWAENFIITIAFPVTPLPSTF